MSAVVTNHLDKRIAETSELEPVFHYTVGEKLAMERQRRMKQMDFIDRPMPRWKFFLHLAWMAPAGILAFLAFAWGMAALFPGALPN